MFGVLLFIVLFFAMIAWFGYVAFKDPAGIFKPRPRPTDSDRDETPPAA